MTVLSSTIEDSFEALKAQINSKLEFIVQMVQSPKAQATLLCDLWNQVYQNERQTLQSIYVVGPGTLS